MPAPPASRPSIRIWRSRRRWNIATNLFLGREIRRPGIVGKVFRTLDIKKMQDEARRQLDQLGIMTVQSITQPVESLSGGQRQSVAVARAAAVRSKGVGMGEATA